MSAIFEVILSSVFGALAGSLIFGLWLAVLMWIYVFLYGYYDLGLFGSLPTPMFIAFKAGLIFGGIQGFLVGFLIKVFGVSTFSGNLLISFIATEILIGFLFMFTSFDLNPIEMILSAFYDRFYDLVKTSLVMLVPTIVTGGIVKKAISYIIAR